MKPRNFQGRKARRVANVLRRAGKLPGSYVELPKDIRLRVGAAGRKEHDGHGMKAAVTEAKKTFKDLYGQEDSTG